jgi:hypothetical protein
METFRWTAIVLSMILGFGLTRLLISAVEVFKSRHTTDIAWMPLVWALCIFLTQIQYWWAIFELPSIIHVWTFGHFLFFVFMTLLLFVSGALILPHSELKEKEAFNHAFELHGKWALVTLSGYSVVAGASDWLFWRSQFSYAEMAEMVFIAVLPMMFLWRTSYRSRAFTVLLYTCIMLAAYFDFSPTAYTIPSPYK